MLILVVIVMYALIVLFMDIYFGVAPEHAAATLQACGCCKSIAQRANAHDVAKTGKGSKRGTEMLHDDAEDDLHMASNPLMMQAMAGTGASAGGVDANFSIDKLLHMDHPPGKEMWPSVRMWMNSMHGSVEQLKERLHNQQMDSACGLQSLPSEDTTAKKRSKDTGKQKRRFGQTSTRRGSLLVAKAGAGKSRSQRSLLSIKSKTASTTQLPGAEGAASPASALEPMEMNPLVTAGSASPSSTEALVEAGAASPTSTGVHHASVGGAESGVALGLNPLARRGRKQRRSGVKN